MEKVGTDLLRFETGIYRIERQDRRPCDDKLLPDSGQVLPSEAPPARHLDRLLKPPSLENRLVAFLKPDITRKEILVPARYRALMEDVHGHLHIAAQNASGTDGSRVLENAARLLGQELKDMDLLNMYRSVLLKG